MNKNICFSEGDYWVNYERKIYTKIVKVFSEHKIVEVQLSSSLSTQEYFFSVIEDLIIEEELNNIGKSIDLSLF